VPKTVDLVVQVVLMVAFADKDADAGQETLNPVFGVTAVTKDTLPTKLLMLVRVIVVLPEAPRFKLAATDDMEKSETT
jgi:hypothetical protein